MTETVPSFLLQSDRLKRFSSHTCHLYSYRLFEVFMDIVIAVLAYVKYLYKKVKLYIFRILIIRQITHIYLANLTNQFWTQKKNRKNTNRFFKIGYEKLCDKSAKHGAVK